MYTRHTRDCRHKSESYARCDCSKWLRWSRDNKQHRQSADTRSWAIAEQKAEEQQRRLDAGESPEVTASAQPTIAELAATFLTKKHSEGVTAQTERKVTCSVKPFVGCISEQSKFYPATVSRRTS